MFRIVDDRRDLVAHGGSTSTCTCEAKWDFGKYHKYLKVPRGSVLLGSIDVAVIKGRVLNLYNLRAKFVLFLLKCPLQGLQTW